MRIVRVGALLGDARGKAFIAATTARQILSGNQGFASDTDGVRAEVLLRCEFMFYAARAGMPRSRR
jgi:hypothetical protein